MTEQDNEQEKDAITRAVDEILRTHNLPVSEEDYEWMIKNYSHVRQMVAKMRIPEARYASPALIYSPLL